MLVLEEETSIWGYVAKGGGEEALSIAVRCGYVAAVEEGGVVLVQCGSAEYRGGKQSVELHEMIDDLSQENFTLDLVTENLVQGYGVGGIADEEGLVDVDPHADKAAREVYAFEVVLDEDAAKFLILIIYVVGPLDTDVLGVLAQHVAEGNGDKFA